MWPGLAERNEFQRVLRPALASEGRQGYQEGHVPLSLDWPLPPTQMFRIEANGKNRGSRPDIGGWGKKKCPEVCTLQVGSGRTCFPGGKKTLELLLLARPLAERHGLVRGDIRVSEV